MAALMRTLGIGIMAALVFEAKCSDMPLHPRPVEIERGELTRRSNAWVMKGEDFSRWRIACRNLSNPQVTSSSKYVLWENSSACVSFKIPERLNPDMEITLYPAEPPVISEEFDRCQFYVCGPKLFHAWPELEFTSSDGLRSFIPAVGGGHHWNLTSYWGTALTVHRPAGKAPWRLTAMRFKIVAVTGSHDHAEQEFFFDEFSFFKHAVSSSEPTWHATRPTPTTPDTIKPPTRNPDIKASLQSTPDGWEFTADDNGQAIKYRVCPRTGTFSDIEVIPPSGKAFLPAVGGGPEALVHNIAIKPDDRSVTAILLDTRQDGNSLYTTWRREKGSRGFTYEINLTLKGKSLVIDLRSEDAVISHIRPGRTEHTPNLLLQPISYWDSRYGTPVVMVANGVFTTLVMDAWSSHGSYHIEGGHDFVGLQGRKLQLDANHASLLGGTAYLPDSNGDRNPVCERWFLNVSEDIDEVLPSIPNPASPFLAQSARRVYASRPNFLTSPEAADAEVAFWSRMKAYGVDDIFVRYHMEVLGSPIETNRICRHLFANSSVGDAALKRMISRIQQLGYKVALYGNNRVIHGLAPEYNSDELSLGFNYLPNEQWSYSNYLLRPGEQLRNLVAYVPKILGKFGTDSVYSDEQSNVPPWAGTDYESGVPGAGKFSEVLFGNMAVLLKEKELYNAPIWSEGTAHHFLAGYTDLNYAQSNRPDNPVIVDYQLREIHTRENGIGYEVAAQKAEWSIDYWLASTIVFGNMGHLKPPGKHSMMSGCPKQYSDFGSLTKGYFMTRALQELYSGKKPECIRYADKEGRLHDTSAAILNRAVENNMVYTRYENGMETWVNRNAKETWAIDFGKRKLLLPPEGYAARLPGKILEYSAGEPRQDYVSSGLYTYVDGRGSMGHFPEITAKGAYVLRRAHNSLRLIPQGTIQSETVILNHLANAMTITPLDAEGRPVDMPVSSKVTGNNLELAIDASAFQYRIDF